MSKNKKEKNKVLSGNLLEDKCLPDDPRAALLAIKKHIDTMQKGSEFMIPFGGDKRASLGSWQTWTFLYGLQMISYEAERVADLLASHSSS